MAEDRNLFGMLDEISASQADILTEVTGIKEQTTDRDSRIAKLEEEIQLLKESSKQKQSAVEKKPQTSSKEILTKFLKESKKSWRWFGTTKEFLRCKGLTKLFLIILLVFGVLAVAFTNISCNTFSVFSIFEIAWMGFGAFYLINAFSAKYIYEINALASHSSYNYEKDQVGMLFPTKEKWMFKLFLLLALIASVANIIFVWTRPSNFSGLATAIEILFIITAIASYFVNLNLYAQYSIIWIEGHSLTTKEKVVLVLLPGAKQLISEEEFKKKMPFFYE